VFYCRPRLSFVVWYDPSWNIVSHRNALIIKNATQWHNGNFLCIGRTEQNYLFRGEAELKVYGKVGSIIFCT